MSLRKAGVTGLSYEGRGERIARGFYIPVLKESVEYRPQTELEKIICLADNFASGADRREDPEHSLVVMLGPVRVIGEFYSLNESDDVFLCRIFKRFAQPPRDHSHCCDVLDCSGKAQALSEAVFIKFQNRGFVSNLDLGRF